MTRDGHFFPKRHLFASLQNRGFCAPHSDWAWFLLAAGCLSAIVIGQDPKPQPQGVLAEGEAQMTVIGISGGEELTLPSSGPSLSFSTTRGAERGHVNDWLGLCLFSPTVGGSYTSAGHSPYISCPFCENSAYFLRKLLCLLYKSVNSAELPAWSAGLRNAHLHVGMFIYLMSTMQ